MPAYSEKTIHSLWFQGESAAPKLVRRNFETLRKLEPDWDVVIHDAQSVKHELSSSGIDFPDDISLQALSDIFRIALLHSYGGLWVDASVLATKSISSWLPAELEGTDFFAYAFPDQIERPLASWCLYAKPESYIVKAWFHATRNFWTKDLKKISVENNKFDDPYEIFNFMKLGAEEPATEYPYFWFHHLFGYLLTRDDTFATEWRDKKRPSADVPHQLQFAIRSWVGGRRAKLDRFFSRRSTIEANFRSATSEYLSDGPIHKLNWRQDFPVDALFDELTTIGGRFEQAKSG